MNAPAASGARSSILYPLALPAWPAG